MISTWKVNDFMPGRNVPLVNGEYYHLYNRGSEKRNIFTKYGDYQRFLKTLYYYQFIGPKPRFSRFTQSNLYLFKPLYENKLIELLCYCLMPNHFHLLLRQLRENGISIFMSQLSNSYTKYFNVKYNRVGALLQGGFKSVLVENDEQLIHVSRYIHLNPIASELIKDLPDYKWSSYFEYARQEESYCSTKEVLSFFPSREKYKEFLKDQIDYAQSLEIVKHQLFEE